MLLRSLTAGLLAAKAACALKTASPFVLLSTEPIPEDSLHSQQISTVETVERDLTTLLTKCDASTYHFIEQPGLRLSDIRDSSAMPKMAKRIRDQQYKGAIQIPEVIGQLETQNAIAELTAKCGEKADIRLNSYPELRFEKDVKGRRQVLQEQDHTIDQDIASVTANHTSHVIIWTSTSSLELMGDSSSRHYEMDEPPFHEEMHTDLKRDVDHGMRIRQSDNDDDNFQKGLPLFEKYQFLTPGIFMGLSVSILLFTILYVGVSAIAGLEVSYMAFSKEMGPQAQKKQQ